MLDLSFYKGKKVLVTGHTGFKGSWMCQMLAGAGAEVTGYALQPQEEMSLFELLEIRKKINSVIGDIRDLERMEKVFREIKPEIVIHMAAQPLVRESYKSPVHTYDVNVMGTVNVLESVRMTDSVRSFVNVTTDKVYKNREWEWGYRENEELNGFDPYSNAKSCSELVTDSYKHSFFQERDIAVSTARAGNVIGGGDFAADRIIPDCVRSACKRERIIIRNPYSVRPYQHVLEPVTAYLMIAMEQYTDRKLGGSYNIGPEESDCLETGALASLFCSKWEKFTGQKVFWENIYDGGPHEAQFLKLDCSRIKKVFGWAPRWNINMAVEKTAEWAAAHLLGKSMSGYTEAQIRSFLFQEERGKK